MAGDGPRKWPVSFSALRCRDDLIVFADRLHVYDGSQRLRPIEVDVRTEKRGFTGAGWTVQLEARRRHDEAAVCQGRATHAAAQICTHAVAHTRHDAEIKVLHDVAEHHGRR